MIDLVWVGARGHKINGAHIESVRTKPAFSFKYETLDFESRKIGVCDDDGVLHVRTMTQGEEYEVHQWIRGY
jgi:hypothetical protein